jgi:uncharacterized repeat protein (TIGR02543 family)
MLKKVLYLILILSIICLALAACDEVEDEALKTLDELLAELPEEEVLVYVGDHDISQEAALIKSEAEKLGATYIVTIKDNENNDIPLNEEVFTVEYGKTYTVTLTVTLGSVTRTKTITLRAARNFTVTFNLNGGTGTGSVSYTQTVIEEEEATLPQPPTKTNYIFAGWSPEPMLQDITADATYTAQWTPTYLISFIPNGGSAVSAIRVYQGEVRNMPASTREGYFFNGWYTDNGTFSTEFSLTSVSADTTVYADWVLYLGTPRYVGIDIPEVSGVPNEYLFEYPSTDGPLSINNFTVAGDYEYTFGELPDMSSGEGVLGVTVKEGETTIGTITIRLSAVTAD